VFTQPWPAGPNGGRRDQVIYYQYRHDRARRTLRGTGEQVAKAHNAIAGKAPIKRNRFIQLSDGTHSVNRELETKARALAGIKGYITNLGDTAGCGTRSVDGVDRGSSGSGRLAGAANGSRPLRWWPFEATSWRSSPTLGRAGPWRECAAQQAAALVAALADPDRGWEAIVIGEYERAFYGGRCT
jgi:hypothetical protein